MVTDTAASTWKKSFWSGKIYPDLLHMIYPDSVPSYLVPHVPGNGFDI